MILLSLTVAYYHGMLYQQLGRESESAYIFSKAFDYAEKKLTLKHNVTRLFRFEFDRARKLDEVKR